MTKLFLEILDDARISVLKKLSACAKDAVLAGGTSLALQIGHRRSFDFDLFIPRPIPRTLYKSIQELFHESPMKHVDTGDQLTVELSSGIEITFLYYWYAPLYPPIPMAALPLCDKSDIATDKAMTIGRRNAWRDYVDFFFLLKDRHVTLAQIITDAEKRFGNEFSKKLFLQQLSYTGDIKDFSITYIGGIHTPQEITEFLERQAKNYATSSLPL
ncbi:MAG: nucleotidyl transferase AbiEii/AbiGii toxin family protein [Candidatus Gottesmanbacteria bacterium]|nr:nucleotidyl transferase AbiEii/AbiGii toxin family protein [Candidatus Gottesmanbacteria bacterium]